MLTCMRHGAAAAEEVRDDEREGDARRRGRCRFDDAEDRRLGAVRGEVRRRVRERRADHSLLRSVVVGCRV